METPGPSDLAKILDSEIVKKLYDDALVEPAKEVGGIATDLLKGLRCFTLPFVLMAKAKDRLLADLDECRRNVPEDRQTESPPEIAGPVIERLKFMDDSNPLRKILLNLLATSIDSERQALAHPAFATILSQLSAFDWKILDAVDHDERQQWQGMEARGGAAATPHSIQNNLKMKGHEVELGVIYRSLENLERLGLTMWETTEIGVIPWAGTTIFAGRLLRACNDPETYWRFKIKEDDENPPPQSPPLQALQRELVALKDQLQRARVFDF